MTRAEKNRDQLRTLRGGFELTGAQVVRLDAELRRLGRKGQGLPFSEAYPRALRESMRSRRVAYDPLTEVGLTKAEKG